LPGAKWRQLRERESLRARDGDSKDTNSLKKQKKKGEKKRYFYPRSVTVQQKNLKEKMKKTSRRSLSEREKERVDRTKRRRKSGG